MKHGLQSLETEIFSAQREWSAEGIPVLQAEITLPQPVEKDHRTARRIHRFYQLQGRSYLHYCEHWLAPKAAAACRRALEDGTPLPCYTARLTHRITCNERGIWSLHTDSEEFTGGRPLILRRGDTWDLTAGFPIPLTAFFPRHTPVRSYILKTAAAEIRKQEEAGTARYAENWPQAMKRTYNRENYFVTPDGVVLFWQMLAIAPAAEGIPAFSLPFAEGPCRWPLTDTAEKTGRCR